MAYKPQQGRIARTAAFWAAVILGLYGCVTLHRELSGRYEGLAKPLGDMTIPIVSIDFSPSFVIASALFLLWFAVVFRTMARPKNADLLIETESELRKVTWPTMQEATNSSLVVIFTVVFLMIYMGVCDRVLSSLVQDHILGIGG